ncbi:MAG TPA: hypothetical protein VFK14_12245 [Solirubrobacterales bacterium]|nr:hypothetical protein [Solirubrobacterales bacterium]
MSRSSRQAGAAAGAVLVAALATLALLEESSTEEQAQEWERYEVTSLSARRSLPVFGRYSEAIPSLSTFRRPLLSLVGRWLWATFLLPASRKSELGAI